MIAAIIIIAVIVILAVIIFGMYNGLIRARTLVDEDWAQIETQLQRRYDLIPNLIETVKGYAKHEEGVLNKVTEARTQTKKALDSGSAAEAGKAEKAFQDAMVNVNALAEAYPDLKASQNFLSLQEELATTENKVANARMTYNRSVGAYNVKVDSVPTNVIASMFNFTKREFFNVENEEARQVPKVQF